MLGLVWDSCDFDIISTYIYNKMTNRSEKKKLQILVSPNYYKMY